MIVPEYVLLLISASVLISILLATRVISKDRFKSEDVLGYKILVFSVSIFISYFVLEKIVRFDFYKAAFILKTKCLSDPYVNEKPEKEYSILLHLATDRRMRFYYGIGVLDSNVFFDGEVNHIEKFTGFKNGTISKNLKHYFEFDSDFKGFSRGIYLYSKNHYSHLIKVTLSCKNGYDPIEKIACIHNDEYKKDMSMDYLKWSNVNSDWYDGFFHFSRYEHLLKNNNDVILYRRSQYWFSGSRVEDAEKSLQGWGQDSYSCKS